MLSPPSPDTTRASLRRLVGVSFGIAVIVGGAIGVGILRMPAVVAAQAGSPQLALLVWSLAGVYTLLGSVCLTELGAMLPQAGGYYVYARRAFGDTVGFLVGWTDWLTYCSVLGYVSIASAEFAAALAPPLAPLVTPLAIAALLAFAALQWLGLRVSGRVQEVTSLVKCLAFLALVAACVWRALQVGLPASSPPGSPAAGSAGGLVLALQSVVVTYGGWQSALYFTEEDRDPARNLARSMIGGVTLLIALYLLVNLALMAVLPMREIAASTLPAATAAAVVFGARGGDAITALSIVSLLPVLNAILMLPTRILFAMGRDGVWPSGAARVNAHGTPSTALMVTAMTAVALVATGTFAQLIALTAFFLAANYCACCAALIVLRRREPALPRPFRAWGFPWSAWIVAIGAALFLVGGVLADRGNSLAAIALILVSWPMSRLLRRRSNQPAIAGH